MARSILADHAAAIYAGFRKEAFEVSCVNLNPYTGLLQLPGQIALLTITENQNRLMVKLMEVKDFHEAFEPMDRHTFCFASDPHRTPVLFFKSPQDGTACSVQFLSHVLSERADDRGLVLMTIKT